MACCDLSSASNDSNDDAAMEDYHLVNEIFYSENPLDGWLGESVAASITDNYIRKARFPLFSLQAIKESIGN